jgi:hypothetical protein
MKINRSEISKLGVDPKIFTPEILHEADRINRRQVRVYLSEMGADPGLADLSDKIKFADIRILSRSELVRFGIVSQAHYETPWLGREDHPDAAYTLLKAFSRRTPTGEQQTTTIGATCFRRDSIKLFIDRERPLGEADAHKPLIRISSDDIEVWASINKYKTNMPWDYRQEVRHPDALLKAIPKRTLEYSETFEGEWADRSNSVKLSIEGLGTALMTMRRQCERIHGAASQPARVNQ